MDIAALSEVHLHEDGILNEHGADYTLYWTGKPKPKITFQELASWLKIPPPPNPPPTIQQATSCSLQHVCCQLCKPNLWKKILYRPVPSHPKAEGHFEDNMDASSIQALASIDYVLVPQRNVYNVRHTGVISSTNVKHATALYDVNSISALNSSMREMEFQEEGSKLTIFKYLQ
ncbi:hypothetical protein LOAG_18537 [Loa loa]|uniref:Uncharacterized protein n=1 Tax=Loa loa TaxID=7209 RepID=A0A1S0UET4_LOALO|nr:hypothetical protein LOAG_18537 [Loa loa]EJD74099.1 hypothetical protein LOAG_18537 [Loa loa]